LCINPALDSLWKISPAATTEIDVRVTALPRHPLIYHWKYGIKVGKKETGKLVLAVTTLTSFE